MTHVPSGEHTAPGGQHDSPQQVDPGAQQVGRVEPQPSFGPVEQRGDAVPETRVELDARKRARVRKAHLLGGNAGAR